MRIVRGFKQRVTLFYMALFLICVVSGTAVVAFVVHRQNISEGAWGDMVSGVVQLVLAIIFVLFAFYVLLITLDGRRRSRDYRRIVRFARLALRGDLEQSIPLISSSRTPEMEELVQILNGITSKLKRVEGDFSNERDKLYAILSGTTNGVVLLDGEDRVALINSVARNLLDLSNQEVNGRRFVEVVLDHELNSLAILCRTTKNPQNLVLSVGHSQKRLSVVATALVLEQSHWVLLVFDDLTQAYRVDTTRREFVANVSHELRTPLASIKASAETLYNGASEDPKVSREFLHRISLNVDRMSSLIEELLDLSRLESGESGLNLSIADINKCIQEAADIHIEQSKEQGVSLAIDTETDLPTVMVDIPLLQQVLSNLIGNGIKFTPRGGKVTILVRSAPMALQFSVTDTGIGMAAEHIPHAFERFYKVDRSVNTQGTGLGLAIAKHIVEAHGGSIWVQSQEGEGSIFSFTIPSVDPETMN